MSPFAPLVALAGTTPKEKREYKRDPVKYRERMKLYMRKRYRRQNAVQPENYRRP